MSLRLLERLRAIERELEPPPKPEAGLPEALRRAGVDGPPMTDADAARYDWRPIDNLLRQSLAATAANRGDDDARPDPPAA